MSLKDIIKQRLNPTIPTGYKLKKVATNPDHTVFDIILNGKTVGYIQNRNDFEQVDGWIHGKQLPTTKGSLESFQEKPTDTEEQVLHRWLKSAEAKKWFRGVDTTKNK
jgi:hypothetical protein